MSHLRMMVNHRRTRPTRLRRLVVGCCLAWMVVVTGTVAVPSATGAEPDQVAATSLAGIGLHDRAASSLMCRPEPPDYPGCSPAQVRPLLRARFASEYTGHARGYRYHRMGQHHRGVIFAHLTPALNSKLARLYHKAVVRYAARHTSLVVDTAGVPHAVATFPRYRTWAGFRSNTTALCNGTNLTVHFPTQYCWSLTKLAQAGRVIRSLLNATTRIAFSCDGYAIGGWASGTYAAWRMGTGLLHGGYYGAVGVEIGCQTTSLWNWVGHLW